MNNKEKQTVHDWSNGALEVYEIEVEALEPINPTEPNDETPSNNS